MADFLLSRASERGRQHVQRARIHDHRTPPRRMPDRRVSRRPRRGRRRRHPQDGPHRHADAGELLALEPRARGAPKARRASRTGGARARHRARPPGPRARRHRGELAPRARSGRRLGTRDFLELALGVVEALAWVHARHVIHKDLHPGNLVVAAEGTCADHRLRARHAALARVADAMPAGVVEGTLAYVSPEQTGRINRVVDSRSDFYSLGVTFYELLTGRSRSRATAWSSSTPTSPAGPCRRTSSTRTIPEAVSAIVMKLCAKTAEERYQSCAGLRADLEACLSAWCRPPRFRLTRQRRSTSSGSRSAPTNSNAGTPDDPSPIDLFDFRTCREARDEHSVRSPASWSTASGAQLAAFGLLGQMRW